MHDTSEEDRQKVKRAYEIAKQNCENPTFHGALELNQLIQNIKLRTTRRSRHQDNLWDLQRDFRAFIRDDYDNGAKDRERELEERKAALNEALNAESDIDQQTEIIREQEHVQDELDNLDAQYADELRELFEQAAQQLGQINSALQYA